MTDAKRSGQPATPSTIYNLVAAQAQATPDEVAITAPGQQPLTYRGLLACLRTICTTLNEIGIGRNDRVAVILPNGPEMAVAFLGVASAATCAPLNPALRESELTFALESLNIKALILQAGENSPAREIARRVGICIVELLPSLPKTGAGHFTLAGVPSAGTDHGSLAEADDIALVLHTSGTTSRPKSVPLTQQNLCASACHIRDSLALAAEDRCLNVMPLFHIHGLIGALLSSLAAGASVACTLGFQAPSFFPWMDECRPTWYTAVPTMHQAILQQAAAHQAVIQRRPLRFIRSCSSALPPQVMAELEKTFGTPVVEAYGMTEASHQIACNPLPPLARKPGSAGITAGPEVAVMDEAGRLLTTGERGEIVIRGINVTPGYENNPEANRGAFADGWFRTGDQGYLDAEGYIFLTGRIKELINRGGEKLSPREIDEVLMDHPAVAQALAFAMPHPQLGEDVAAAVVLQAGMTASEQELRLFVAKHLADFKVPRRIVFLQEIPKGPTGKLQRIGLAEKLGVQVETIEQVAYVPPRSPMEIKLAELLTGVLGLERVGVNDNFLQLGGDSVLATLLLSRIRETLQVAISPIEFFEMPTIAELALKIIERKTEAQNDEMLMFLDELDAITDEEAQRILSSEGIF